jgi:hypothetical protein
MLFGQKATHTMANEKHLALLQKGVEVWNQWRASNAEVRPDLSGAELGGANLHGVDLNKANLQGADLTEADLSAANLGGANLGKANLSGADLSRADVCAELDGADLRRSYLHRANFSGANLTGADLSQAIIAYTIFGHVDLSSTRGLESVEHEAPSSIGVDTIDLSKGNIPHVFLRGAGVPDNFIEYMSSLTGKAFEYYSCFISYSTRDQEFAARLYADLQAKGVRCWFAPHDVQGGKKLIEQIDDAIRVQERLLLILSPDSINSEWVKAEIAKARQREVRDKTRVLFPVRMGISFDQLRDWEYFDADIGKDSAREIREYYIPDFSRWKSHDSYQEEFAKLLRDLTKA